MDKAEDIKKALEALNNGGLILYPTDTVWAIGCDATNSAAVAKVYALKKNEDSVGMIVLIDNANRIPSYIREMPEIAYDLIDYADNPLTIIFDDGKNLAPTLMRENGSIAIRVVKDDFCAQLIQRFNRPIVSTSANISGKPSPNSFSEIEEAIKNNVDYVIQHNQTNKVVTKRPSVMQLSNDGAFKLIRE